MNRYIFKAILAYALIVCSNPAYAMLATATRAALRPNLFATGKHLAATLKKDGLSRAFTEPSLITGDLIKQSNDLSEKTYQSYNNNSTGNDRTHRQKWIRALTIGSIATASYLLTQKRVCSADELPINRKPAFADSIKELIESSPATQTTQHFKAYMDRNIRTLTRLLSKNSIDQTVFKDLIKKIILLEQQEQEAGKYTFVHAYPWNLHFLQDIHACLYSIVYNTQKRPLSLRFNNFSKAHFAEKHTKIREIFLSEGWNTNSIKYEKKHKYLISMNFALFAGLENTNSLEYFITNKSFRNIDVSLEKLFKKLNLEKYLLKYEKEFQELALLHENASEFGAGILISFSPEMLKKSVYVSGWWGAKGATWINRLGETDDVKLILDILRSTPEKIGGVTKCMGTETEFIFVVTKDCGLNPLVQESGDLKIIPFNAANPEKLALYEQKRDELMTKIKADIEAEQASWSEYGRMRRERELQEIHQWYVACNCLNDREKSRIEENV